ncbi:tonsoku-like protein [Agelaius tricolor]|uniref:tonsoku-like protein n=1 Tax=Agelaius tricolor TaxID=9191 RepID=UPI0039F1EB97
MGFFPLQVGSRRPWPSTAGSCSSCRALGTPWAAPSLTARSGSAWPSSRTSQRLCSTSCSTCPWPAPSVTPWSSSAPDFSPHFPHFLPFFTQFFPNFFPNFTQNPHFFPIFAQFCCFLPQHQLQHLSLARSLRDPVEQQRAWATIGRTFLFMAESPEIPEIPQIPEFPEFPKIPEEPQEAEGTQGNPGIPGNSGISGAPTALRRALQAFHNSLHILETQLEGAVPVRELAQMRSRLCLNLGLVQESLGNARECSRLLWDSLHWADASQSLEDQFRAHLNLGLLLQRSRDLQGSLRSLGHARDCARKLGEPRLQGEAQAHLGQVLLSLGDFEGARRALSRALSLGQTDRADGQRARHGLRHGQCSQRAKKGVPCVSLSLCPGPR